MKTPKVNVSDSAVISAWKQVEVSGNIKEVAKDLGIQVGSLRKRAAKLGLYKPQKQRHDYTIEDCIEWATQTDPGGKCLSEEYLGQNQKHLWKCSNPDHSEFEATAKSVKNGSWCKKCFNERRSKTFIRHTTEECHAIANERSGRFLSPAYTTGKLQFSCEFGHVFERTLNEILHRDRWCPICSMNLNEEYTRFIFETIFNTEFEKTNLVRLGLSSRKLELDGYSSSLKLAFEYNGIRHTRDPNHPLQCAETIANDAEKARICEENGIRLIIINEYPKQNPDRWLQVEKAFAENDVTIPPYQRPEYLPPTFRRRYHERIEKLITDLGGKLITPVIATATDKIVFICEKSHVVRSLTPQKLLQGQWCKHQISNRKLTQDDIDARAANVNSKFLGSYRREDGNTIWIMECAEGHRYERKMSRIKEGYGCNHPDHEGNNRFDPYEQRHDEFS
jgi:hypothetical protein